MKSKLISVILFFILIFVAAIPGKPAFAEKETPELEFLIENARKGINKQEALINSLRKRYENILKRKRALQQFIDQENKKIEESKLAKAKCLAKPLKAAPVSLKRFVPPAPPKAPKEHPALREEKERQKREQEIAKRNAVQDEVLRQQGKNAPPVLKPAAEKKKITLAVTEEQKQVNLKEESLKRRIAEQEAQLAKKEKQIKLLLAQEGVKKVPESEKKVIDQAEKARKQQKDQQLLSRKLEKERLLAEEKEQRMIRAKECQMRLLLEADKNAKHEKYVSQLGQLLNRQNFLLEESRKLESQIHQEEETLKVMERTRQELIRKLLENP